jgi:diguanylate cyclase (GGDEF)-like protein
LKQNLAIEPDLQNFIGFVLECVNKLGGNPFAASIASLNLMQKLRNAGAATGFPLPACLVLWGKQLWVQWGEHADRLKISDLAHPPTLDTVAQLRRHLQNSTASADPSILLLRNAEMMRHFNEARARTEKELETLQQTLAKRQNELHESLHQAETDPLTGLLNRRAFDEKLGQAFRHTMRQKNAPLSLVLFDLDHFKDINDQFGHQFGDTYLNKMAHALRRVIREDVDFAFRFGGDEFAMVIFADHPRACDKARAVLQMMDYKVSIGITAIDADTPETFTLEEFVHKADKALYAAKRGGRGRAVVGLCPSPDSSGCAFPCPLDITETISLQLSSS